LFFRLETWKRETEAKGLSINEQVQRSVEKDKKKYEKLHNEMESMRERWKGRIGVLEDQKLHLLKRVEIAEAKHKARNDEM
jgi:hypothetical protein